ncbi:hypothetical protein [Actibacterium sp. MT2.3-13A]|uniref:hypothetical protein n=1 Tax=Actibacterium sp. MT2.3-13A TaxID=2828332 RepID=UPI001BA80B4C|nr:hypothetical protein [Actibacterium sp. MT2.3-13A]
MTRIRPTLALALSLMLAVTSLTLAVARGQAPVAGVIELCSGAGMAAVPVDAEGKPTGPAHVCPDGVAALVNIDIAAPAMPLRPLADGERLTIARMAPVAGAAPVAEQARGPPA